MRATGVLVHHRPVTRQWVARVRWLGQQAGRALQWVVRAINRSLPMRIWNRLSWVRGTVLVKGIAYSAFFSLFPLLALGFTVFGVVLRSRPDLREALEAYLVSYLQENLPGAIRESPADPRGLVYPGALVDQLTAEGLLTATGIIGLAALIWGALGWVGALRLGIRAAMHLPVTDFHPAYAKARDLVIAVLLGGAVVVVAVASVTLFGATDDLLGMRPRLGWFDDRTAVRLAAFGPIALLDATLFYLQFKLLAAATLPRRYLVRAAVAAAVIYGGFKLLAGDLLQWLLSNSVLAVSFSVLALLVWLNLVARITLLAAAWAGLMAEEDGRHPTPGQTMSTRRVPVDPSPARGLAVRAGAGGVPYALPVAPATGVATESARAARTAARSTWPRLR